MKNQPQAICEQRLKHEQGALSWSVRRSLSYDVETDGTARVDPLRSGELSVGRDPARELNAVAQGCIAQIDLSVHGSAEVYDDGVAGGWR